MSVLSLNELKAVITGGQAPAVSIFLPTHRAGPAIQQDPIRLKNLVKQAEDELIRGGQRTAHARDLMTPVSELIDDAAFWRHQQEGLAIFRSTDVFRFYRTPLIFEEFVFVSERFYVKPLLPLLFDDAKFYVLALSHKTVRLLECSRHYACEVELPDMPHGVQEALPIGPAPELQKYTLPVGGHHDVRLHAHGVGIDDADVINLARYFQRVEDSLKTILKEEKVSLVLACVEYLAPIFREITSYQHIADKMVTGNPDGLKNDELRQKAWSIVEEQFQQTQAMAAAQYYEGLAKGRASHSLVDVLPAAYQGRIATLFFPLGVFRWGRFTLDTFALEEHEERQPSDDELLDLAAVQTLMHGGTVYGVGPQEIPGKQLLAAVFRF